MVTFKSYQEFFESIDEVTKNFLVTFFYQEKVTKFFFCTI